MKLAEVELEFGEGQYLFRLPPVYVDKIQKQRGFDVTWPDGSTGKRPKPIGMIALEIMGGQFDILDCIAIILSGAQAGGRKVVDGVETELSAVKARIDVEDILQTMTIADIHETARAILGACWYGFDDGKGQSDEGKDSPKTEDSSTSEPPPKP